jgi:orotate phosphoribosyltransferase
MEEVAETFADQIELDESDGPVVVLGPAFGSVTLAYQLAHTLRYRDNEPLCFFTEPMVEEGKKIQRLNRFDLPKGALVILTEDVVTTGGSVISSVNALPEGTARYPDIFALVDRRVDKSEEVRGMTVKAILTVSPRVWDTLEEAQKDCPNVTEALRPKANWDRLKAG